MADYIFRSIVDDNGTILVRVSDTKPTAYSLDGIVWSDIIAATKQYVDETISRPVIVKKTYMESIAHSGDDTAAATVPVCYLDATNQMVFAGLFSGIKSIELDYCGAAGITGSACITANGSVAGTASAVIPVSGNTVADIQTVTLVPEVPFKGEISIARIHTDPADTYNEDGNVLTVLVTDYKLRG